jgi:hypothetical protein
MFNDFKILELLTFYNQHKYSFLQNYSTECGHMVKISVFPKLQLQNYKTECGYMVKVSCFTKLSATHLIRPCVLFTQTNPYLQ